MPNPIPNPVPSNHLPFTTCTPIPPPPLLEVGDEAGDVPPLPPAPARAGRAPSPAGRAPSPSPAAAHLPPAPKIRRCRPETPASGDAPATPAPATPAATNSQLAALGKKHAADRTAQGRAYDKALVWERTRFTNLEADYGRYQVARDAEHHTHLAVSKQLKQSGKRPSPPPASHISVG